MGQVKLYLDSFFVSGFWLHFFSLGIVRRLSYQNRRGRTASVAAVAALCALFDLCGSLWLWRCGAGARYLLAAGEILLAVRLCFGGKGLLLNGISLFFVTALLGGIFSLLPVKSTGLFCLGASLLFFAAGRLLSELKQRKTEQGYTYEVNMKFMEEQKDGTAYLDTGNRLRMPGSGLPVIVARAGCVEQWIDKARDCCPQNFLCLPFHSVGGTGLLYGVKAECRVFSEKGTLVFSGRAAVMGTETELFSGKGYDLLLPLEILSYGKEK